MNHPIDQDPESNRRADPETNTDAFNQAGSKQGRLTYSRLGGILSAMGFGKARTPNGCSTIMWDDQLLFQNTFSDDEKMKNSHPHVPHVPQVPQVQPVGQDPRAPFHHGIHKGQNTQRVLRHHLGRPTTFMVSFRTTLRIQIQTYIILCLRTVWR